MSTIKWQKHERKEKKLRSLKLFHSKCVFGKWYRKIMYLLLPSSSS